MGIRDWPIDERPREQPIERGAAALTDGGILAILSGGGSQGRSAVAVAREVLRSFGLLHSLIGADRARFCACPGLGLTRYTEIQAAAEWSRRRRPASRCAGPVLASQKATRDFLTARLRDLEHEVFSLLYLDQRHRLIQFAELFRGTIDAACVHSREIGKLALRKNAAAVIVAHDHPLCFVAVSPPYLGVITSVSVAALAR